MLTALALISIAHATEIATSKKFGIGLASGPGGLAIAGKYYLDSKGGIAGYLGTSWRYQAVRVNYEREFYQIESWGFARLDLYWDAGVDIGSWFYYGKVAGVIGFGGGVGAELQFHEVPLNLFLDIGLGIYPVNAYDELDKFAGFGLVAPRGALGARWYF